MIFNTIPANKQMFFYRDEITSPAYRVKLAVENGKKDIKIFNAELHRKEFKMEIGMMADDHLFIKIYKKNGSWIVGYSAAGVVRPLEFAAPGKLIKGAQALPKLAAALNKECEKICKECKL